MEKQAQVFEDFKEGLTAGIDKLASAFDLNESEHTDFVEACGQELERSFAFHGIDKEAAEHAMFGKKDKKDDKKDDDKKSDDKKDDDKKDMKKEAGFGSDFAGAFGGEAVGKAALGMGIGALGGLGAMAVKKVGKSFGSSANRSGYDSALQKAISSSEILQNDPQKAKRMGDSIFGFAPKVSQDSNVLTNILVNAIHGDSIDLQTIRAVTELEEKLGKMNN